MNTENQNDIAQDKLRPLTTEEKNATGLSEESLAGALTTGPLDDSLAANELRHAFKDAPFITEATMEALRQASSPAPAGKLTDEQLGEIGAKAAYDAGNKVGWLLYVHDGMPGMLIGRNAWRGDAPAREAFARAVREAVEKERAEEIRALTSQKQAYKERAESKHGCWMQELEKTTAQAEEIARLTAELEIFKKIRDGRIELQAKYDDLQVTMDSVTMNANWSIERMKEAQDELASLQKNYDIERNCSGERMTQILELQRELSQANERVEAKQAAYQRCAGLLEEERLKNVKANAELERLRWRSVEVKPTREDADVDGDIMVYNATTGEIYNLDWQSEFKACVTHWRPACPPPAPTAEEVEK